MSESSGRPTWIHRTAAFIVDRRKGFYLIYILLLIFSLVSANWVKVDNDITDYLSEETETRRGLNLMDEEFVTYATAQVMIDNVTYDQAEELKREIEDIEGVKEVAFDNTEKHYQNASALFSVTFAHEADDPRCETTLGKLRESLSDYDTYISAELGDTKANTIAKEVNTVMVIVAIIILAVLLFTSHTYLEIPVLVLTFGAAALLNRGTNYMFGTISFVSNSVAVVLQLALAIDYAIILCHRYLEERETHEAREAVIEALTKAIPEISGSCLTTLSGLAAMSFMTFRLGFDMSIVLIKAIVISILTVFTLMPGLLMSFSPLIDRTHHRNFVPSITPWINGVVRLRNITPYVFGGMVALSIVLSYFCPYAYSYTNLKTFAKNESQIAQEMIDATFPGTNVLAVVVPAGDYQKEQKLVKDLEAFPEVESVTALSAADAIDGYRVGDALTPRQFSELSDIDIELARLMYAAYAADKENYGRIINIDEYRIPLADLFQFAYDLSKDGYISLDEETQGKLDDLHGKLEDGKRQLEGEAHTRLVMNLAIPEESEETFRFLDTVRASARAYYGDEVLLVGNSTNDYDLSATFEKDNIMITVLSVLFVLLVLFFTFQSAGLPIILILVIQGSIWMNFAFPTLNRQPIFFMSYLVVSAIQMGANIDYAIVITNRYQELRRHTDKISAIREALELAFPTIFTSGSILGSAGIIIGLISSDAAISSLGIALGRGTIISIILVMGVLPQLLVLGDYIIQKTSFNIRDDLKEHLRKGDSAENEA